MGRWRGCQVGRGEAAVDQVGPELDPAQLAAEFAVEVVGVSKAVLAIALRTSDQMASTGLRAGAYGGSRTVVSQSCPASYRFSPAARWVLRLSQTTTMGPPSWMWARTSRSR